MKEMDRKMLAGHNIVYFGPEKWPDMDREGRKYVEKNFDINKLNDRLVQLYQFLLDGRENDEYQ